MNLGNNEALTQRVGMKLNTRFLYLRGAIFLMFAVLSWVAFHAMVAANQRYTIITIPTNSSLVKTEP